MPHAWRDDDTRGLRARALGHMVAGSVGAWSRLERHRRRRGLQLGGMGMAGRHGRYRGLEHVDVRGVGVAGSASVGH